MVNITIPAAGDGEQNYEKGPSISIKIYQQLNSYET